MSQRTRASTTQNLYFVKEIWLGLDAGAVRSWMRWCFPRSKLATPSGRRAVAPRKRLRITTHPTTVTTSRRLGDELAQTALAAISRTCAMRRCHISPTLPPAPRVTNQRPIISLFPVTLTSDELWAPGRVARPRYRHRCVSVVTRCLLRPGNSEKYFEWQHLTLLNHFWGPRN